MDYLPIPTVTRNRGDVNLSVTLFAEGTHARSVFVSKYVLRNISARRQAGSFYLAVRPYQVNPTYQWLNAVGGVADIRRIRVEGNRAEVNGVSVSVSGVPAAAGATHLDAGGIVEHMKPGLPGTRPAVADENGYASAAFDGPVDTTFEHRSYGGSAGSRSIVRYHPVDAGIHPDQ
jgi:hypothetical protein